MKKTAIYARTSTELQEKQETINSQIVALEEYAKDNGYEIIEKYTDDGWTGTILARPGLDRLRDDAQKGIFETVLIYDPDRLARRYAYQALVIEELEDLKIEAVFLNRPKAETPEDKILQGFQGLFAEYERAKIMERTRRGKLHKAKERKIIIGNTPPYGYDYIPKAKTREGKYKINEQEAKVVRIIFDWLANDKCSLQEIRKRLFKRGIKTRNSKSLRWQNSTLSRLVRSETYIGRTFYNKTVSVVPNRPANNHQYKRVKKSSRRYKPKEEWIPIRVSAIINKDIFCRAQEQLRKNFFFAKRNQKYQYLLSGLLFCGKCSSRLVGDGCQRGYRYYRDTNRIKKFPEKKTCGQSAIKAEKIEELVWEKVAELLNSPKLIAKQLNKLQKRREKETAQIKNQVLKIEKEIGKLKHQEQRLFEVFRQEVISLDQFKEQIGQINSEKKKLKERKIEILSQPKKKNMSVTPEMVENYCKLVRKTLPELDFKEKQQLLRLLVDKVILKDKRVIIQGILPAATEEVKDVGQGLLRGDSRFRQYFSHDRSRYQFAFPSSLQNRWPAR